MSKRPRTETNNTKSVVEVDEYLEELRLYEARKRYNVALKVGAGCTAAPKPILPQEKAPPKKTKARVTFADWDSQLEELQSRERRMAAAEEAMWSARKLTAKLASSCGECRK